ncbi:Crp/Fnr family transcriptional regulator [Parvularcula marina]|uniref:Crp/Fnr family transcriptional regulator n=1 Tax=Parvularcula marina TaxID=2292771 RepID=UPI003511B5E8
MASEELKRIIKEGAAKEQGSGSELSCLRPFELLDADCLAGLELAEEKVSYEAGDTVVVTGQFDGTLLYGLISGTARIVRPAVKAGDFDVQEANEGDVVGLAELLASGETSPSGIGITALTDLEILLFDGDLLLEACKADRKVADGLLRYAAQQWLASSRPADTEAHRDLRIYRHLISLAERDGEKSVIREMPRHSQLAEQCGVTDRDAAAAVALLIDKGIVRRDYPSLVIEDMAALRASAY